MIDEQQLDKWEKINIAPYLFTEREVAALIATCRAAHRYRKALEFYANMEHYDDRQRIPEHYGFEAYSNSVAIDRGQTALEALSEGEK